MPDQQVIEKAYLQKVTWGRDHTATTQGNQLKVQFNPQTLRVSYSNQKAGGRQPAGSAVQFVGSGSTQLTVELVFDVTAPLPDGSTHTDVTDLTQPVVAFIKPESQQQTSGGRSRTVFVPPGIRFGWGTFLFDGVVDSVNETLEFFSNEGKPLRATMELRISRQEITLRPAGAGTPGTAPQATVAPRETLQQLADRLGLAAWQPVAASNNVENPRQPPPGTTVDPNRPVSASTLGATFPPAAFGPPRPALRSPVPR